MAKLVIQKYGGSSVASTAHIRRVARRIKDSRQHYENVVVVVSAMQHMTDNLTQLAYQITNQPIKRELDMLMTAGERVSMSLLAVALNDIRVPAVSLTGSQVGILTDTSHTNAKITEIRAFRLEDELKKGKVVVVAGFQGVSSLKEVTTLGRGGSDVSAVALSNALKADKCEIYTDVDGIYSADPYRIPQAIRIKTIDYEDMANMAYLGAEVMHPRAIAIAKRYKIPINVRSSFDQGEGTTITEVTKMDGCNVVAVVKKAHMARITVTGFKKEETLCSLFQTLEKEVDLSSLITSIEPQKGGGAFTLFVPSEKALSIHYLLSSAQAPIGYEEIELEQDQAVISIIGEDLLNSSRVLSSAHNFLHDKKISYHSLSGTNKVISLAVEVDKADQTAELLHEGFLHEGLLNPIN